MGGRHALCELVPLRSKEEDGRGGGEGLRVEEAITWCQRETTEGERLCWW